MNKPSNAFLRELAKALSQAEHKNVAEHFTAGLLYAMYPEWFDYFIEERGKWVKSQSALPGVSVAKTAARVFQQ